MPNERFQFPGAEGQQLAAALELPEGETLAYALFAHCFTCGKDVLAAKRIAVALAAKGIAVLRFDFTGPRLQRRRFRQLDVFVQCRRSGARRRSSARDPKSAGNPDRPQPRRRRGAGRRRANSGSKGCRHHRGAIRPRARHPFVRRSHRRHPQAWRGRSLARRPAVSHQARIPRRYRRAQFDGPYRQAAQSPADHAFADRRHRRHRQRHPHLRRRETSEEFCVAARAPIIC